MYIIVHSHKGKLTYYYKLNINNINNYIYVIFNVIIIYKLY